MRLAVSRCVPEDPAPPRGFKLWRTKYQIPTAPEWCDSYGYVVLIMVGALLSCCGAARSTSPDLLASYCVTVPNIRGVLLEKLRIFDEVCRIPADFVYRSNSLIRTEVKGQ